MPNVLAIDLGASSGRAIIGSYIDGALELKEVNRFDKYVLEEGHTISWNMPKIMQEIKKSIKMAGEQYGFKSIAIDTWGVDFGLLDSEGKLIRNPIHYRDPRTEGMIEEIHNIIPLENLYDRTGIQIMAMNTVFQLAYLKKYEPEIYKRTDKILMMPDLINYLLSGEKYAEKSIASTTQLFNPKTKEWDFELIDLLGIKKSLFPQVISSGKNIGSLKESIQDELSVDNKSVLTVTGHDTACAISSVPTEKENPLFLSSGTWSLLGKEIDEPIISAVTRESNLSNEIGVNDYTTLLRNITGLWIIQESKRYYEENGRSYTFAEIANEASKITDSESYIDIDNNIFGSVCDMPIEIEKYLIETNQEAPKSPGHTFRIIYESLAMKYKEKLTEIESINSSKNDEIFVIGGGSNAEILCQMTADATGKRVVAGPSEATAYGNIIQQLISLKILGSLEEGRSIVKKLNEIKIYEPSNVAKWERKYEMYKKIIE